MTIDQFSKLTDLEKTILIREKCTFLSKYPYKEDVVYIYSFYNFFIEVAINFKSAIYSIKEFENGLRSIALVRTTQLNSGRSNFYGNLN